VAAPATAKTGQRHGDLAARRFPLVPRPKPPCRPLAQRIDRVARLADQASQTAGQPLTRAAEACNLAALIASDCDMTGLARDLCWRQHRIFAQAGIHDEATAKLALQPLVNLARLHIRDGDGDSGYQLLEALFNAVRSSRPKVTIDRQAISLTTLTLPGDHRKAVVQWLWTVLLSDGLRALCRAGRWAEALHQARLHNGIGQRLLDGRQIAVLACCASGQHDEAGQILREATVTEPWEHALAACLHAISRPAGAPAGAPGSATHMTGAYLATDDPHHPMFTARLGLTIAELTDGHDGQQAVIAKVAHTAIQTADAYIARELLTSPVAGLTTRETRTVLQGTIRRAGLAHPLTTAQLEQLTHSVSSATTALQASLNPIRT
jgi:hypothetical protein